MAPFWAPKDGTSDPAHQIRRAIWNVGSNTPDGTPASTSDPARQIQRYRLHARSNVPDGTLDPPDITADLTRLITR